jgi:hypothetical protein
VRERGRRKRECTLATRKRTLTKNVSDKAKRRFFKYSTAIN